MLFHACKCYNKYWKRKKKREDLKREYWDAVADLKGFATKAQTKAGRGKQVTFAAGSGAGGGETANDGGADWRALLDGGITAIEGA